MIYFFTVAAPARSGTMWYSRVFTTEHSFCFHELSTHLLPYPSVLALVEWLRMQVSDSDFESAQRRMILQGFPNYFARLWERAIYSQHIVGNSDHFLLGYLPGLWLLWPNMKFVFSVRNGINCVQSRYVHQPNILRTVQAQWEAKWQTSDLFSICCWNWRNEIETLAQSKTWLEGKAQCIETHFEQVTTDLGELRKLWDWIGIGKWDEYAGRSARLLQTPINARINKQRVVQPEEIWQSWSSEQRKTFRDICGETMSQLGYSLPD